MSQGKDCRLHNRVLGVLQGVQQRINGLIEKRSILPAQLGQDVSSSRTLPWVTTREEFHSSKKLFQAPTVVNGCQGLCGVVITLAFYVRCDNLGRGPRIGGSGIIGIPCARPNNA
jgi:hypothetical protein